ncbi:Acylphosphatase [groundwater metagenome]|uniref:Acylphosphatase n=1 Tax=groundwater metagenome TaxID=717931 RepID=A0A098EAQ7_9ZZZZ
MKRANIIVKGEVQRVGYRDAVEKIARKLNIKGCVENLIPYDVKILAEAEEESLKRFIETIKIKKYPIDVESVEVNYKEATNEFEYFKINRGDPQEELAERFDVAGKLLYRTVELGEKSVALGEKSVSLGEKMLEKQDAMLGKQDLTIGILRDIKQDTKYIPGVLSEINDLKVRYDLMEIKINKIKEVLNVPVSV